MNNITTTQSPHGALFTCLTCQVAFHDADRQRSHYHSDWHRYNLKRKVAELPPVSADAFATKVLEKKNQLDEENEVSGSMYCLACRKDFGTENAYNNHIQSKKHKENETKFNVKYLLLDQKPIESKKKEAEDNESENLDKEKEEDLDDEEKLLKLIDDKIKRAVRLSEVDCIFCNHKSEDFEGNMEHMSIAHSFFIPDIEYLVDLKGLIKYLGEKVSIANVCLYCNGKGRELKSLEAVRGHMISKGHTKIAYDLEMDILEISDYYDFSKSYNDADQVDPDAELINKLMKLFYSVELAENEMELILPNGARIGHRSMARYYKQYIRPIDEQEERGMRRLIENGTKHTNQPIYEARGRRFLITNGEKDKFNNKQMFKDKKLHDHYTTRVGINANKLQRHFREQIL
ncbi:hypothetical protein K502DRAFT_294161 [Neoconidiobolus thromboides FSU 785]|nr:hypothetical protein K502DRAFT_294161 [Neoconidiobolus thromboides FSU 785]